jgi:hypothetical protein
MHFLTDLRSRLTNRIQLTSDGHRSYLTAVDAVFGEDVDYAMLNKIYGADATISPVHCEPNNYKGSSNSSYIT